MKVKRTVLILFGLYACFHSPIQAQKSPDPKEVGTKAFNILKTLDKQSAKKFASQMMNLRDFHKLVEEYAITDELEIQNISNMLKNGGGKSPFIFMKD